MQLVSNGYNVWAVLIQWRRRICGTVIVAFTSNTIYVCSKKIFFIITISFEETYESKCLPFDWKSPYGSDSSVVRSIEWYVFGAACHTDAYTPFMYVTIFVGLPCDFPPCTLNYYKHFDSIYVPFNYAHHLILCAVLRKCASVSGLEIQKLFSRKENGRFFAYLQKPIFQ